MNKPTHTLEIYKDRKKEFRFRVKHKNGKILFESSESYKRKSVMMKVWNNFLYNFVNENIVDLCS